jgi:pimeloyl-ACP methyl ester carboxylesterase
MRELVLDTPRGRFAALRHGRPGQGPRVLALHGWLDNAASFTPLAALLPALDLVALDFAGHGHSCRRPPGSWYHLPDNLDDVAAVLEALGWERCHLLGHSLGGAVAVLYAAAVPDQVDRLLLVESLGPLPFRPGTGAETLRTALAARRRAAGKAPRIYPDLASAVAARRAANGLSEPAARLLVERGIAPVEGGFRWRSDPRLTLPTLQRAHEAQVLEWLAAVRAPTLVIAAEPASAGLPQAARQARFAALATAAAVQLPGNHHLHLEEPAPVAAAIRRFLSGPTPAAA